MVSFVILYFIVQTIYFVIVLYIFLLGCALDQLDNSIFFYKKSNYVLIYHVNIIFLRRLYQPKIASMYFIYICSYF